jgi:predicted RNase H-like nuclease (RuvC/YqgF family)
MNEIYLSLIDQLNAAKMNYERKRDNANRAAELSHLAELEYAEASQIVDRLERELKWMKKNGENKNG